MQPIQRRTIYSIILILGFTWIFISSDKSRPSTSGKIPTLQQEFCSPDFELKSPKGKIMKRSDLRGQAVLVNL